MLAQSTKPTLKKLSDSHSRVFDQVEIDLSNFHGDFIWDDSSLAVLFSKKLPKPLRVIDGKLNITAFYLENDSYFYAPIQIRDKDSVYAFDIFNGTIKPKFNASTCELQPSASTGKLLTAAMLIKVLEDIEEKIDCGNLLKIKNCNTLMDVDLKSLFEFLASQPIKDSNLDRFQILLDKIHVMDLNEGPEITPRSLLNHTARIPEWFRWKDENGQTVYDAWNNKELKDLTFESIMRFNPIEALPKPIPQEKGGTAEIYSNGNTLIAGLLIEIISNQSIQHNLDRLLGKDCGIILTKPEDLDHKQYVKMKYSGSEEFKGMPNDPGYTAGGYMIKLDAMAEFLVKYLNGDVFDTDCYKSYIQSSFKDKNMVLDMQYSNSLEFWELSEADPLKQSGYTHLAGHGGVTSNMHNKVFVPIKIDNDGKIISVGRKEDVLLDFKIFDSTSYQKCKEIMRIALQELSVPAKHQTDSTQQVEQSHVTKKSNYSPMKSLIIP